MIAPEEIIAKVRVSYGRTIEDILAKAPERDLYDLLGAIQTLVGSKIYKKLPTSPAERMVFAFTWMSLEVRNGGFHQYFFNSAGDFWKDVLDGLVAIGDEHGLALFKETLAIFPNSAPSQDRVARQRQLRSLAEEGEERMWHHFNDVTARYFSAPFPKWEMVLDYVKRHTNEYDLRDA